MEIILKKNINIVLQKLKSWIEEGKSLRDKDIVTYNELDYIGGEKSRWRNEIRNNISTYIEPKEIGSKFYTSIKIEHPPSTTGSRDKFEFYKIRYRGNFTEGIKFLETILENVLEIKYKNDHGENSNNNVILERKMNEYVDKTRIQELELIKDDNYDLSKLIKLCKELNHANHKDCFYSIALLVRSIIDHIPPIFEVSNFNMVANNYSGSKSFKKSMEHLNKSLRNIADLHLHSPISNRETLPNETQVNFRNDLDLLLAEIIKKIN